MNIKEKLELHKKWLNNDAEGVRFKLYDADLSYAKLSGADLRYADLSYAKLSGAALIGIDLRDAKLSYAKLSGTNLSGANLSGAALIGADLSYADLSYADLSYASLQAATLTGTDLSGAKIRSAIGNGKEIKTIQTDQWVIVYTKTDMAIGCQQHSISDWLAFDDDRISEMDQSALEFWRKWKPILTAIGIFAEVM